jgi:hypothetical protein
MMPSLLSTIKGIISSFLGIVPWTQLREWLLLFGHDQKNDIIFLEHDQGNDSYLLDPIKGMTHLFWARINQWHFFIELSQGNDPTPLNMAKKITRYTWIQPCTEPKAIWVQKVVKPNIVGFS